MVLLTVSTADVSWGKISLSLSFHLPLYFLQPQQQLGDLQLYLNGKTIHSSQMLIYFKNYSYHFCLISWLFLVLGYPYNGL